MIVCLFVGCLTSQQHASVSQGRIYSDNFTYCHTEIEVADPTIYLTQSQYTDTGPTSARADPTTPGAWQGSHWSANFEVTGMTRPRKIPAQAGFEPGIFRSRGGRLNHWATEAVSGQRAADLGSVLPSAVAVFPGGVIRVPQTGLLYDWTYKQIQGQRGNQRQACAVEADVFTAKPSG